MPGIDVVMDLFRFPWDFEDNSVDEIWCSHLIEHIPHEAKKAKRLTAAQERRWDEIGHLDGFFAFFAEVWRILKPSGTITICTPYGMSTEAMQDPTHTRFIVPKTLHYLTGGDTEHYNYHTPFKFTLADKPDALLMSMKEFSSQFPEESRLTMAEVYWNMAREMRAELVAVK